MPHPDSSNFHSLTVVYHVGQERAQDEVALAMAEVQEPLDESADGEIEWTELKSQNVVTFRCGVKKSDLAGAPVVAPPEDATAMAARQGARSHRYKFFKRIRHGYRPQRMAYHA